LRAKRVYKFYAREWGLEALERRRLKVSTLHDLNDPFEFQNDTSEDGSQKKFGIMQSDQFLKAMV